MNETLAINATAAATTVASQPEVTFSVLNYLPPGNFTDAIISLNANMSAPLQQYLPHKWFFLPFIYDPIATLFITFVIVMAFTFALDFLRDAWKIPFAIVVDILDVMAITNPWFNFIAGLGTVLVFSILTRDCAKFWRIGFIAGGLVKTFTPGLAMLPLNTIMMFIATVVDRE